MDRKFEDKRKLANAIGYRGKIEKSDIARVTKILFSKKADPKQSQSCAEQREASEQAVEHRCTGANQSKTKPIFDKLRYFKEKRE